MSKLLLIGVLGLTSCASQYAKRDVCVAPAILDYQSKVMQCKSEKLNFEQCDEKYSLGDDLEKEQAQCRKEFNK